MAGPLRAPAPMLRSIPLAIALSMATLAWGCGSDESCATRADCAEGELCAEGLCVPEPECGDDVDCPGTEQCVDGACAAGSLDADGRFPSDPLPGFEIVDLGEVEVLDGETPDLSFELGADVRGIYLVGVGKRGSFVQPLALTAPDGTALVEPDRTVDADTASYFAGFPGPAMSPNRVTGRPRAAALMAPNTPELAITPGSWTARFAAVRLEVDADYRSRVVPVDGALRVALVKRLVDAPEQASLDVVLSFDASSGLTSATAPGDPSIALALERLGEALSSVGVELGEVTYRDVATALPDPVDLGEGSCLGGDVDDVFDQVEPAPGAVHLVFVDSFQCMRGAFDVGANLAGVSNGIPGLPFATRDGVIVATALKDAYPDDWASVVAHEVGHFLGLSHTEEAIPGIYDNLADTDDALASQYMMYFNVTASGGSTLVTPDQGWVVRQQPVMKPVLE